MNELREYEIQFLQYYLKNYNVKFIKVKHNNGLSPTKVTLYNENKRVIRHQPTYYGVTVKNMFQNLKEKQIYEVDELIDERK